MPRQSEEDTPAGKVCGNVPAGKVFGNVPAYKVC